MATLFQCTNPLCGENIKVPDGAVQVVCMHCNTLHFTSDLELSGSDIINQEVDKHVFDSFNDLNPYQGDLSTLPQAEDVDLFQDQFPPFSEQDLEISGGEVKTSPNKGFSEETRAEVETQKAVGYLRRENGDYLALKRGKNIIGRSNTDLVLSDNTVSRKHCVIEVTGEGADMEFIVYDIGHIEEKPSTNGVFLSGRSLRLQDYERLPLKDGASIEIGTVLLVFYRETG